MPLTPQCGQTKPAGQRTRRIYSRQASSSRNHRSISWKVSDLFSIGASLNATYGIFDTKVAINNVNPLLDDGSLALDDTVWGFGGNIGFLFEPNDRTRYGLTYTSSVDLPLIMGSMIALFGSLTVFMLKEPKIERKETFRWKAHFDVGLRKVITSRAIIILILFQIVVEIGLYIMAFFRGIYMYEDLELEYLWIGLFYASFLVVAAIVMRAARRIEEVLGEKNSLVFMYAAILASFFVVFLVRDPIAIVTQYPIYLVAGIQGPIINAYINRRVDSEHRSTVMAIAVFTFTSLLVVFEIAFGYLAEAWGFVNSIMAMALLTLPITCALLYLWGKEVDRERAAPVSSSA